MKNANILIVEDDVTFSMILSKYLLKNEFNIDTANSVATALRALEKDNKFYDLVLLDYHLPDGNALQILDVLKNSIKEIPVLIMTSVVDVKTAVEAIKKGASDYITKPINQDELLMSIKQLLSGKQLEIIDENANDKWIQPIKPDDIYFIGNSDKSKLIQNHIQLVSPTEISVLLEGETGSGKEHIARAIHNHSNRSNNPFVAIDCGTLNNDLAGSLLFGHVKGAFTGALHDKDGILKAADGGTIFLDELGNLSIENQMKLLRVLQEKEYYRIGDLKPIPLDVRLICATNENLKSKIEASDFREDLYHRINEFKISIPPLRERVEDLNDFVYYFIQKSNQVLNKSVGVVDENVIEIFQQYHWPGNIRELQNIIRRAVLLAPGDTINKHHIPEDLLLAVASNKSNKFNDNDLRSVADVKSQTEQQEKELIIRTLLSVQFNKSKAARLLKIDRTTLYQKLSKYGIK